LGVVIDEKLTFRDGKYDIAYIIKQIRHMPCLV